MKQIRKIAVIVFLILQTGIVSADTLLIQRVEKDASVEKPDRGTLMADVESQYGKPVRKTVAIGAPPITKWVYSNITVYFERSHVIHAVVNRK